MPDLSPDTSIYSTIAKNSQSGLGSMDLGSLLGVAQRARQLQTQSAISNALRDNPDDPQAAMRAAGQAGAYLGPEDYTSATHAAQAQAQFGQWQMGQAMDAIGSLLSKRNPTLDDWHRISPMLAGYHIPQQMLDTVERAASKDGRLDYNSLVTVHNFANQNAGLPQGQTFKGPGAEVTPSAGGQLYRGNAGTGGGPPPPQASPATGGASSSQPPQEDAAISSAREVQNKYSGYGYGGGVVANPSQAVQDTWSQSSREYSAARSRDYLSDVTPMNKVIDLLKKNPNLSGRGMDEFNNIKNFAHSVGMLKDEDMDKVVDFETMKKYMANIPNQSSLGGTDSRLWQSITGSPSPDKLGQTNLNVMRVLLGVRNAQQASMNIYRRLGPSMPPEYFSDWNNSWSQKQDPMAYVWDTMTKQEQEKYGHEHFDGNRAALSKFQGSYDTARRSAVGQ